MSSAAKASTGLEQKGDKATWRFGGDNRSPSRIVLERVALDGRRIRYREQDEDTDLAIRAKGTLGKEGEVSLAERASSGGAPAKSTSSFQA